MGPQMMSDVVQKFLSQWGVHHRQSSAYNPHSNARAELAVKAGKRMLRDNLDSQGNMTDKFYRALLQYRNTPHSDTRLSPAQVIFGRQVRDFLPVLPYKYEPKQERGFLQEDRERALARRLQNYGKRLVEHSKTQKQIPVGTTVSVKNQTGRHPNKWDKTGIVLENQKHDSSRRTTIRNRKYVREIPETCVTQTIPRSPQL